MKRQGTMAAILIVLATNVVVLAGVRISRAGGAQARIELTESQLKLMPLGEENSSLMLRLLATYPVGPDDPTFLDRAKLTELGFDMHVERTDAAARDFYWRVPLKRVYVALKYETENPVPDVRHGQIQAGQPRLVAVDAAREPEPLRQRYPDTSRFLITRGIVRVGWYNGRISSRIVEVIPSDIYVPLPYSRTLAPLAKNPNGGGDKPRYKVTLCYGRTFEPRVVDVQLIAPEARLALPDFSARFMISMAASGWLSHHWASKTLTE